MIRVLIAEDEPPIARALSRLIEELSPSFQVAACESNGQDALVSMRREPADVVFTDIRMPIMDGLDLLKSLHLEWPDCLVVIISGHQDFAYLQTALRLGAVDYLLKPVSREKLRELLERLEVALSRNLLREAVISWQGGGKGPAAGLWLAKDWSCALILAIAGHWPTIADDALSPGAVFWQANDPESLIGDLSIQADSAIAFVGRAAAERVFILKDISPDQSIQLAKDMYSRLTQTSTLSKTLCVLPGPISFSDIAISLQVARKRVYSQLKLCQSSLLYDADLTDTAGAIATLLSATKLTEALCIRNEKQICTAVEALVDEALDRTITQMAFEHLLESAVHDRRLAFQTKALRGELSEAITNAVSPSALKVDLIQIFRQYCLGKSKAEQKSRVEQIMQYLSSHYTDEISSETLSARFGFAPSYLSKVFRRQIGISPTEYLAKLRMGKARELLGTHSDLLIRDVAALVGYKDPYYFSKLFKKSTGLWPTEYQEKSVKEKR